MTDSYESRPELKRGNFFKSAFLAFFIILIIPVFILTGIRINNYLAQSEMERLYTGDLSSKDIDKIKYELTRMGYAEGIEFKIVKEEKFSIVYVKKEDKSKILVHLSDRGLTGGTVSTISNKKPDLHNLEVELETSILMMEGMKNAKIKIVLSDQKEKPSKATVMIILKEGYNITKPQILGIINLVSGSVEGLKPENVKVVDERGVTLNNLIDINNSEEEKKLEESLIKLKYIENSKVMFIKPEECDVSIIVMIKLKNEHIMTKTEIQNIIDILVSSVSGLKPDNIQVIDDKGNMLIKNNAHIEKKLETAIIKLEKIEKAKVILSIKEDQKSVSVTVMVKTKDTSKMNKSQTEEIKNLLIKSIEGLKAENIRVIDTEKFLTN